VRADVVLAMPGINAAASAFARSLELSLEVALSHAASGFNVARSVVKGRRVVVVGGPLLQAQPLQQVVRCLRAAEATEVHLRLAGPMLLAGCLYGVVEEGEPLWQEARSRMDTADLREFFEADSLVVLDAAAVREALGTAEPGWCTACYTQDYPLTPPAPGPLGQLPLFSP
jgi:amidophosphoribosyltransferase